MFGKVDLNLDLRDQIQRLKSEINEVERRGVEQNGRLQRIRNEVGENKKKIKELEAIKVENPSRAGLSFLSLQADLNRMKRIMGQKTKNAKENEEINLADTP